MNSVERVKAICKERKIPIYKLERDLEFANGYISQLKKGSFPDERLIRIAEYLNVSVEYLTTGTQRNLRETVSSYEALTNLISYIYGHCEDEAVKGKYGETCFYSIGEKFAISEGSFEELFKNVISFIQEYIEKNKKSIDIERQECLDEVDTPPAKPIYNMIRQKGIIFPDLEEKYGYDLNILNAAHERPGATAEDKAHDDAIMDDENF